MDVITLTGLRVRGHHGVHDFERRDGQEFVVDVALGLDTSVAARSDELADTVHYGQLAERLAAVVAGRPVNLLETLAGKLAEVCLADQRVAECEVTVRKPFAPIPHDFADVAVTIRRQAAARLDVPAGPPPGGCRPAEGLAAGGLAGDGWSG